jgi:phosphatidylethanolamine-binding protein (PEBP) family uncharacterized protein
MKKLLVLTTIILTNLLLTTGCGLSGEFSDTTLNVPEITVTSKSIVEGELLTTTAANKKSNNPSGENKSPQVSWELVEDANYYAVIMFDESANWLHFFETDITTTKIEEGRYTDEKTYIGPYPPKSSGVHTYRIEVFAIKNQPTDPIGKVDSKESYKSIVNHLNQVGGNSDNILARGYITGTYENGTSKQEDTK